MCTLPCHASFNRTCIILDCASCHDYVVVVYYVVCFLSGALRLGNPVTSCCEDLLATSVCLPHGLVLLPCGISGKMTIPSKSLLSLLASCSFCRYVALPTIFYHASHICHAKPLTLLPSKPLFGYVTDLAQPLL